MNILIIDDEPLVLKGVCRQLSDMDLAFARIDTAGSAQEAREKAGYVRYDIFLCDIVMPEEDGISFARWAFSRFPAAKFIFLTAHADFTYMKEAISMQSFDYVLQPVGKEELQAVVERAIHQISIEEKNRAILEKGSFYIDHETDILEGNSIRYLQGLSENGLFLRQLIEGAVGDYDEEGAFLPWYVQILSGSPLKKEEDKSLFRMIYYNITNEIMQGIPAGNALIVRADLSGDFLCVQQFMRGTQLELAAVRERLEEMRVMFDKLLHLKIAVYLGTLSAYAHLPAQVQDIFAEIRNNVRNASHVYRVGDLSSLSAGGYTFETELTGWKALLQQRRLRELQDGLFRYLEYRCKSAAVNRDFLMSFHQNVSEMLLGYMASEGILSTDVFDEEFSYYDFMYAWDSVEHLRAGLEALFARLYRTAKDTPGEECLQRAIRYIKNNLDKELLVTEIADYVGLHPVYLTRVFKKGTGLGLKRYIEQEKMEAAKNLLSTTSLPVSVIAGYVGYANYSNFIRSFKLITGLTPSEYREK